MAEYTAIYR